jgi:hypothetical protein
MESESEDDEGEEKVLSEMLGAEAMRYAFYRLQ